MIVGVGSGEGRQTLRFLTFQFSLHLGVVALCPHVQQTQVSVLIVGARVSQVLCARERVGGGGGVTNEVRIKVAASPRRLRRKGEVGVQEK